MRPLLLILVLSSLLCFQCASETSAEPNNPDLLICEVMPDGASEGVSIINRGDGGTDLLGFSLWDGEGVVSFTESIILPHGSRITLVREMSDSWFCCREGVLEMGGPDVSGPGRFALNNQGDQVYLLGPDSRILDSFCYGNVSEAGGWSGDPLPAPKRGYAAVRVSETDTDTSADWIITVPGMTDIPEGAGPWLATVTPLLFPDCGSGPICRALESATETVSVSVYFLGNENIIALLAELEGRGVEVRVLIEGSPAGMSVASEIRAAKALDEAGAEVYVMDSYGPPRRFAYMHAKYCVIDSEKVVLTSENWTGSFPNRGWGAVVESRDYAEFMEQIFLNDCDVSFGDVLPVGQAYPSYRPSEIGGYVPPEDGWDVPSYEASVTPVLSPDNSFESMRSFIGQASQRVYSEQLDITPSWAEGHRDSPVSWMSEAADRGADARLILDASFDFGGGSSAYTAAETVMASTSVDAVAVIGGGGFSIIHNKGVVADDTVWIGSVNWTSNSFCNNREAALVIGSPDLADMFSDWFLLDWSASDPVPEEMSVRILGEPIAGGAAAAEASLPVRSDDPQVRWDLDGDGIPERTGGTMIAFVPAEGANLIQAYFTDPDTGRTYSASAEYSAQPSSEGGGGVDLAYAPLAIISLLVMAIRVWRHRDADT